MYFNVNCVVYEMRKKVPARLFGFVCVCCKREKTIAGGR